MKTGINKEKLLKLYDMDLDELLEKASKVTKENFSNEVEMCAIISARTGKCGEDCKYCAQSSYNHANITCHPLLSVEEVYKSALIAKENGATRFGIVTSGRGENGKEFSKILEMIKAVASIPGLSCCGCFGILTEEQIKQIKEAGCERYNHNINTSENYHSKVCTTHTFEDRVKTVKMIEKYGISTCTGVILGMGETKEDRVDMAISLAELNTTSVPINILSPIPGTPFETYGDKITEDEVLRTICIFRIAMPKAILRYAGGRNTRLSHETQKLGLKAGVNGFISGNYLTTEGEEIKNDKQMLKELDLVVAK